MFVKTQYYILCSKYVNDKTINEILDNILMQQWY